MESSKEANIKAILRRTTVTSERNKPRQPTIRGRRSPKGWIHFHCNPLWGTGSEVRSLWWVFFFQTNTEKKEKTWLQYYLQFAHSVETLTERFCRQRKKKKQNKENLQASISRFNRISSLLGSRFLLEKGGGVRVSVQVRADGVKQRYKSKAEWDRKDFLSCGGELLSTPPRGGDPSRHHRQHHGFFSSCFFSIFFQVLSGSASSLGGLGATTLLLLSSFHLQNPLCSFNKAAAGGVPLQTWRKTFFVNDLAFLFVHATTRFSLEQISP